MSQVKQLIGALKEDEKIALVRCEAGKPYNLWPSQPHTSLLKTLRDLELVEKTSWTCTDLGHEVVAELCGVPYKKAAPKHRPEPGNQVLLAETQRPSLCTRCNEKVNGPCIWVANEGIFHEDCVETEKAS